MKFTFKNINNLLIFSWICYIIKKYDISDKIQPFGQIFNEFPKVREILQCRLNSSWCVQILWANELVTKIVITPIIALLIASTVDLWC